MELQLVDIEDRRNEKFEYYSKYLPSLYYFYEDKIVVEKSEKGTRFVYPLHNGDYLEWDTQFPLDPDPTSIDRVMARQILRDEQQTRLLDSFLEVTQEDSVIRMLLSTGGPESQFYLYTKNGQLHSCFTFRDWHTISSMDTTHLPIHEVLVGICYRHFYYKIGETLECLDTMVQSSNVNAFKHSAPILVGNWLATQEKEGLDEGISESL